MHMTGFEALRRAVEILRSQAKAAEAVGVRQQTVSELLRIGKKVPAEWCIPLEKATEGEITRHMLRPDLYPIDEDGGGSNGSDSKDAAA